MLRAISMCRQVLLNGRDGGDFLVSLSFSGSLPLSVHRCLNISELRPQFHTSCGLSAVVP